MQINQRWLSSIRLCVSQGMPFRHNPSYLQLIVAAERNPSYLQLLVVADQTGSRNSQNSTQRRGRLSIVFAAASAPLRLPAEAWVAFVASAFRFARFGHS